MYLYLKLITIHTPNKIRLPLSDLVFGVRAVCVSGRGGGEIQPNMFHLICGRKYGIQ